MSSAEGVVYNIQRFCLHDGKGIRTVVFLKGCPLSCVWCCNPESINPQPQVMYNMILCSGCHSCIVACPKGAVKAVSGDIEIDRAICDACGKCADVCDFVALKIAGQIMTAEEAAWEALRDRRYYEVSGGGVTVSGGEPTMQFDFLIELLGIVRDRGVHTAMETSGMCGTQRFESAARLCDEILFDIKQLDPVKVRKDTGGDISLILGNLRAAASLSDVTVRVPLIPGVNMDDDYCVRLAELINGLPVRGVELLPYHRLGMGKYTQLDLDYPFKRTPTVIREQNIEFLNKLRRVVSAPVDLLM